SIGQWHGLPCNQIRPLSSRRSFPLVTLIVETLVPHFINTTTFAARDFWPRRGARCFRTGTRAYPSAVCKERATTSGPKRTAARRVASLFGSGFVAPRSQPHFGGCSLVAPRQNRKSTQQTWSYLSNGVLRSAGRRPVRARRARSPSPSSIVPAKWSESWLALLLPA